MSRLGELGTVITGNTPKTSDSENYVSNDICFVKPSDIVEDDISMLSSTEFYISEYARSKSRILPKQSILVTCIGIIGKVAINEIECSFNQQINAIIPNNNMCNTKYLAYAIHSKKRALQVMANAAVVPIINKKQFSDIEITLPPMEQQQHIAAVLGKVSELIDLRKRQLEKLDEFVKSRFVEMFGDPEHNEKRWKTSRLGDNCRVINGRAYNAEELLDEGKYRVLRVGNFFTNGNWYYSDLELDEDKYCDEGDLLFAWSASFGPKIWHGEKVIYHYHIWRLTDYETYLNKDFFVELLNYNCDVMKRSTHGSTMLHFTKSQMEDQQLILPPLELQNKFAAFVEQIDKQKLTILQSLDKLETLKKSLMQEYFG